MKNIFLSFLIRYL